MPPFTYDRSKLPCSSTYIRLIDLEPSQVGPINTSGATHWLTTFRCHIHSVSITSLPSYTALSYTWGWPQDRTHSIIISDYEFFITSSLATALEHLRDPANRMTLWIDQICINQEDDEEKSAQVPLMDQIYREAKEVLIWLGPAGEESDSLMDVWQKVGQKAKEWGMESYFTKQLISEYQKIITKADPTDQKTIDFHEMCENHGPSFDFGAINALYQRPWFSRVWVLQEFCLGRRSWFVCGEKRVLVDLVPLANQIFTFYLAYAADKGTPEDQRRIAQAVISKDPMPPLFAARARRRRLEDNDRKIDPGTGDKLFQLLQRFYVNNNLQATDPRDKIFGLGALATDTKKLGITPDYRSSTVEQIYTRTARAIIKDGELEILGLAQFPKRFINLPSWVPDWCGTIQPSFSALDVSSPTAQPPLFSASRSEQPLFVSTENDEGLLGVGGYVIDYIEQVCDPWIFDDNGRKFSIPYLTCLSQIESFCATSAAKNYSIYKLPERRAEGVWRIPVGDVEQTSTFDVCRATPSFSKGHRKFVHDYKVYEEKISFLTLAEAKAYCEQWDEDEDMSIRYKARMYEMRNKRPYLSKEGYVGMGPVTTAPGDVVVVLIGARVPYMLRRIGQGRYTFLGEAYCDGVMDGEIIEMKRLKYFVLE